MEEFKTEDIKKIFKSIRDTILKNKDYLTELDSRMGDGDLGLTMNNGFAAIVDEIEKISEDDIGILLMKSGMIMANAVPSTMGTLVATAIIKAGKTVKGKQQIGLKDTIDMGSAAIDGIMQRGKAKRGEKTILDSLYPALEALQDVYKSKGTFSEAWEKAYEGAAKGVLETKKMKSVHGRAGWYAEKTVGYQDPGAMAGAFIIEGIRNYICGMST